MSFIDNMYYCPSCGMALRPKSLPCKCPQCASEMIASPFTTSQWINMSDQERAQAIEQLRTGTYSPNNSQVSSDNPQSQKSTQPSSSVWVSMLRIFAMLALIAGITVSIHIGSLFDGLPSFAVILLGIVLSILSVAGIMVFLDMAADIRVIRQKLENIDE